MLNTVKKNNKNFLLQGSILALAGLFVRFIGLLYRIPMINIIGTVGNGYYTSAYSIYSLFLIISSYSFPTALSKIISSKLANDRYKDIKKLIILSFIIALIVGLLMFSIMYFGANTISMFLQKEKLSFALKALAPTLFIMAFLSVLRGIFQGMGNMVPTAISQIFEQISNAIFSVVLAKILFDRGLIANLIYETEDYEYALGASGGAIGTGVGAFTALVFLLFLFFNYVGNYKKYFNDNNGYKVDTYSTLFFTFSFTIMPIILSSTIFNISSVIDDFVFSNSYALLNKKDEIVSSWGIYGQYHLLFNIPVAISNSLSSSIIPSLSTSVATNNAKEVVLKIKSSLKFTLLIVFPSFIGLAVLSDPICKLLFNSEYVDILIQVLRIGSIAVVTYSLSTVTISILQGLGHFNIPVINSLIALIIHILVMLFLVLFVKLGLYSIIISNIIFSLIVFMLNINNIHKLVRYKKFYFKNYILPFICSLLMGIVSFITYNLLNNTLFKGDSFIMLVFKLIITIFASIVTYVLLINILGVINKNDAEYMPFINRFYNKEIK